MKTNLHIGLKRTVLFEKHSIEHEKRMFLLEMLDGCELKINEYFPNSVFYIKDGIFLFEQNKKNSYLCVDYYLIWSVFESKYSMNHQQIQVFIKHTLKNPLKWKEFKPKMVFKYTVYKLKNPLKWKEFTPNVTLLTISL